MPLMYWCISLVYVSIKYSGYKIYVSGTYNHVPGKTPFDESLSEESQASRIASSEPIVGCVAIDLQLSGEMV